MYTVAIINKKVSIVRSIIIATLMNALVLSFLGCSRPQMSLIKETPPSFQLSGTNRVSLFQVSSESGILWKIYPKKNDLSLGQLGIIKYGQVPSSCYQAVPEDSALPPPLVEGETYYAVAIIFDSDAIRTHFTIKDGKIVELR